MSEGDENIRENVVKLFEDVHLIECPWVPSFARGPALNYFVSVFAILGKEITLIDSGAENSPDEVILPYLNNVGRKPEEISHVILTHGHRDHCGGVPLLKDRYSVKVAIHELDRQFIEDPSSQYRERFGISAPKTAPFSAVQADIVVKDGDTLTVSGHEFTFISLPGHTIGSMAVIDRKLGLYMTGDTPQGKGEYRPNLAYNAAEYEASVKRLSSEPIKCLGLGHPFPPLNKAVLKADEAKFIIRESLSAFKEVCANLERVLKEANKPCTLEEITNKLPEGSPRRGSVGCLLDSLVTEGKARMLKGDKDPLWTAVT